MPTRLIINADDYGRNAEVSRGIRYAHLNGIVTSTTCMMNMPSVESDLQLAQSETPDLGLGVHLILTAGQPLLASSLTPELTGPDGKFHKLDKFTENVKSLNMEIVRAEWKAQIDSFIAITGSKPTHIDSHHHSSYFTTGTIRTMIGLAKEYNLPIRLPFAHGQNPYASGVPEALVDELSESGFSILDEMQPRSPDAFFASFYDETATRGEFHKILSHFIPNGCYEIMCHPGFITEEFARESAYSYKRQDELEILTDPQIRKEIDRLGIKLINFKDI